MSPWYHHPMSGVTANVNMDTIQQFGPSLPLQQLVPDHTEDVSKNIRQSSLQED